MDRRPVTIEIRLDPADLRRWQFHVVRHLASNDGVTLRVVPTPRRTPVPRGLDLLFALERLLHRGLGETAADRLEAHHLTRFAAADRPADLLLDLVGDIEAPPRGVLLAVDCLGAPPLDGAAAAIAGAVTPVLRARLVVDGASRTVASWPVAVEDRLCLLRSASLVVGRAAHLVLAVVDALRRTVDPTAVALHRADIEASAMPPPAAPVAFLLRALTGRVADRLSRVAGGAVPVWTTAWRSRRPGLDPDRPDLDPTPFRFLRDDAGRFFADPFPFADGDRVHLFCEEMPWATGRGVISVATIEADGSVGPVRPVLEQDCHLSYPHVFAHAGRVWMVPETSARRTVELWVADRLPDRWRLHAILLDDVDVGDATLAEIDGRWWLFGVTREPWTSSWEAVSVWSAPDPAGPWTAHPKNPTLVDVRAARPAGRIFRGADGWCRPVQDCEAGYGSGLAVAALRDLTLDDHRETVIRRFAPPAPYHGIHTWNRTAASTGLFEAIDLHGPRAARADDHRLDLGVRPAGRTGEHG